MYIVHVHVLESILDNSQSVKKNPKLCSLLSGAGSGYKISGAGAAPKQDGSETLQFLSEVYVTLKIS